MSANEGTDAEIVADGYAMGLIGGDALGVIFEAALGRKPQTAADFAELDDLLPEFPDLAGGAYHS
ncbi:MAG: hypothetical protein ACRDQE_02140 [Gaiellales bacterium]